MEKMKLLLTAMMAVAIVALSVGCPHIATKPLPIVETPTIKIGATDDADWLTFGTANITIASTTQDISFRYTIDGTTPTSTSTLQGRTGSSKTFAKVSATSLITKAANTTVANATDSFTLKVIAVKNNHTDSAVTEMTFNKKDTVATPVITPNGGLLKDTPSVTLTCPTVGAKIYYTLNGNEPTVSSIEYTGAITLSSNEAITVKAIALVVKDDENYYSAEASAEFTLAQLEKPVIGTGVANQSFVGTTAVTLISSESADIYYTIDDSTPATSVTGTTKLYTESFSIAATTTVKAIATKTGYTDSEVATATFTLEGTPIIAFAGNALYFDYSETITFSNAVTGATYYYTIADGNTPPSDPTASSTGATTITLSIIDAVKNGSSCTLKVIAIGPANAKSPVAKKVFTKMKEVAPLVITPVEGSRDFQDSVDITLATPSTSNTEIFYKVGGNTEQSYTGKSFSVGSELKMNATVTITARATRLNHKDATATATFTKTGFIKTVLVEVNPSVAFEVNTGSSLDVKDVKLTKSYQMGIYEVTQAQWNLVMDSDESTVNTPKVNITHLQAVTFCNKLSEKEGLSLYYKIEGTKITTLGADANAKYGYRLPTEVEWEYAAREGLTNSAFKYSGSDIEKDVAHPTKTGVLNDVGILNPNALGIYDMSGNAAEMCFDFSLNFYPMNPYVGSVMTDPAGGGGTYSALGDGGTPTVRRGGSQGTADRNEFTEVWRRMSLTMGGKNAQTGFRVVRTVAP